jgi:hypothetical protein
MNMHNYYALLHQLYVLQIGRPSDAAHSAYKMYIKLQWRGSVIYMETRWLLYFIFHNSRGR